VGKSNPMDKSFDISKRLVWEAYKSVKANQGAAGVDGQSVEEFEADLRNNLYKIWNRMSSGTYFPPPVRAVEIPKPHGGGTRVLGVPTVADRIAQTVVALQLLPRMESIFHDDSFGYRPRRSPLAAVKKCRERCWKKDWVLDLDVQKFFDSVDHEGPPVIHPIRTEHDVKLLREPHCNALVACGDLVHPDRITVASLPIREADKLAVRTEDRQRIPGLHVLPDHRTAFTIEKSQAAREHRAHDPCPRAIRLRYPISSKESRHDILRRSTCGRDTPGHPDSVPKGREDNVLAVRRPYRPRVGRGITGQLPQIRSIHALHPDIGRAGGARREGHRRAIW